LFVEGKKGSVKTLLALSPLALFFSGCGSLEKKSILIGPGDNKEKVLSIMGAPDDRQFSAKNEVWQYCATGAGFGYHDYRMIWFYDGRVTGVTSYKDSTPDSSCAGHFRPVKWEEAPDQTNKIRTR
jgi:hypothetical protein